MFLLSGSCTAAPFEYENVYEGFPNTFVIPLRDISISTGDDIRFVVDIFLDTRYASPFPKTVASALEAAFEGVYERLITGQFTAVSCPGFCGWGLDVLLNTPGQAGENASNLPSVFQFLLENAVN